MKLLKSITLLSVLTLFASAIVGCGEDAGTAGTDANAESANTKDGDHTHGGWWCVEHGIPEEQCAMCNSQLAASMRSDGDWCESHNRPESQCFKCDPSRANQFTALYEAKYGKKPPVPTD